jgi:uncharacterized protein (TIGR02996 family)
VTADLDALFRAILLDPFDDLLRLAYADALDEARGGENAARAEFVRIQVAITNKACKRRVTRRAAHPKTWCLEENRCECCDLRRREYELLTGRNAEVWFPGPWWKDYYATPWPDARRISAMPKTRPQAGPWVASLRATFRRGFAESVTLRTQPFFYRVEALFQASPIVAVKLDDRRPSPLGRGVKTARVRWRAPGPDWHRSSDRLPAGLWELLAGGEVGDRATRAYRGATHGQSRRLAFADLSQACVRFGRRAAGLPDLPAGLPREWGTNDESGEGA